MTILLLSIFFFTPRQCQPLSAFLSSDKFVFPDMVNSFRFFSFFSNLSPKTVWKNSPMAFGSITRMNHVSCFCRSIFLHSALQQRLIDRLFDIRASTTISTKFFRSIVYLKRIYLSWLLVWLDFHTRALFYLPTRIWCFFSASPPVVKINYFLARWNHIERLLCS